MIENKKDPENVFEPKAIQFFRKLLEESKKSDNPKEFKVADEDIMPNSIQKRRVIFCRDDLWKLIEDRARLYSVSNSSALRLILKQGLTS